MVLRANRWAFLPFLGAVLLATGSAGQTISRGQKLPSGPLDVQQVLSWLPPDTETVIVARDFMLPDPARLKKSKTHTQEWLFASLALMGTWGINAPLADYFKDQKVLLAVQGSRRFRSPKSLGLMPFEGCTLIIFAEQMSDRADKYFKAVSNSAKGLRTLRDTGSRSFRTNQRVTPGQPLWGSPDPTCCSWPRTQTTCARCCPGLRVGMGQGRCRRLCPSGVTSMSTRSSGDCDTSIGQGGRRPSSPFWDPSKFVKAPWTDEQAIGLTFSYDPAAGKGPTITYLSGEPNSAKELLSLRHEGDKFRSAVRQLDARAIAGSYSLEHPEALMFTFYLTYLLGHGIFL